MQGITNLMPSYMAKHTILEVFYMGQRVELATASSLQIKS